MDLLGSVIPEDRNTLLDSGEYLWTALGMTLKRRKGMGLPTDLIIVHVDGIGGYDCVVGKGERFGQVVYWDSFCAPDYAYPVIPTED